MNWDSASALAEIIGAIAVVVSLIYVAAQIRQNTRMVAANTFQTVSATASEMSMRLAENPELAALILKMNIDPENLTPVETMQIQLVMRAVFRNFENYYYQYQLGYLEEDMWNGYKQTMLNQISISVGETWWKNHQIAFGKRFVDFINKELIEHPIDGNPWLASQPEDANRDA